MNSREILVSKLDDMRVALNSRDTLAIESVAEETELSRNIADRDLVAARINLCSTNVKEILDALARLDAGEYGVCVECDGKISPKRIAALPWAKRCIQCQEMFDTGTAPSGYSDGSGERLAA